MLNSQPKTTLTNTSSGNPSLSNKPLPAQPPIISDDSPEPDQPQSYGTNQKVAENFSQQIQNSNFITLSGTVIISDFALQVWGDENKGGQALLKYDKFTGWRLISLGGGVWSEKDLIDFGVPSTVANRLVRGMSQ